MILHLLLTTAASYFLRWLTIWSMLSHTGARKSTWGEEKQVQYSPVIKSSMIPQYNEMALVVQCILHLDIFSSARIKASVSTKTKEACASGNFLAVSFRRSTTANPQALALQAKEHVSHYQQKQNRETICQNKQAFCSSKQLWQCNYDKWRRKKKEGTVNRDKCIAKS